jgi:hypothetical protein
MRFVQPVFFPHRTGPRPVLFPGLRFYYFPGVLPVFSAHAPVACAVLGGRTPNPTWVRIYLRTKDSDPHPGGRVHSVFHGAAAGAGSMTLCSLWCCSQLASVFPAGGRVPPCREPTVSIFFCRARRPPPGRVAGRRQPGIHTPFDPRFHCTSVPSETGIHFWWASASFRLPPPSPSSRPFPPFALSPLHFQS